MLKIKMNAVLFSLINIFFITCVFAASPVFTLTPLTSTSIQVRSNNTATVQYTVQNQSKKSHTLVMKPIAGITQITSAGNCPSPFVLNYQQSCRLTLQINGNQLPGNIQGGPEVCQQSINGQANPLLCYQPSFANILRITLLPAQIFYVGTENGNVYFSNNGESWTLTNPPAGGSPINSIFATLNIIYAAAENGFLYYSFNNGHNWTPTSSPDGSAIHSVFLFGNIVYVGTANGNVYHSSNNGLTWQATAQPNGSAVTAIFVSANALYAGTENGFVFISTNNGATWTAINGKPDDTAVRSIYIVNGTIYVDTAKEFVHTSTAIMGGGHWDKIAQTVFSLFVASDNTLYAATQSGYVYSLTTGNRLGFVNYGPINTIFVVN